MDKAISVLEALLSPPVSLPSQSRPYLEGWTLIHEEVGGIRSILPQLPSGWLQSPSCWGLPKATILEQSAVAVLMGLQYMLLLGLFHRKMCDHDYTVYVKQ